MAGNTPTPFLFRLLLIDCALRFMLLEIDLGLYNLACRKWRMLTLVPSTAKKERNTHTQTNTLMYTAPSVIWANIIQANRIRCAMVKDVSFFGGLSMGAIIPFVDGKHVQNTQPVMVWTQWNEGYWQGSPPNYESKVFFGQTWAHQKLDKMNTQHPKHHRDWPITITCHGHNHLNLFELLAILRPDRTKDGTCVRPRLSLPLSGRTEPCPQQFWRRITTFNG